MSVDFTRVAEPAWKPKRPRAFLSTLMEIGLTASQRLSVRSALLSITGATDSISIDNLTITCVHPASRLICIEFTRKVDGSLMAGGVYWPEV